jgi:putative FmdB family regulatory protein
MVVLLHIIGGSTMPIYEFECESCGHKKEILILKKSDMKGSHKLGCDKCKGMYKKVMSAPNHNIEGYSYKNGYGLRGNKKNDRPSKREE